MNKWKAFIRLSVDVDVFLFINYRDAPESDINYSTDGDGHRYFPYTD